MNRELVPRERRSPIPASALFVVRGDALDPDVLRRDALRFLRRFPDWGEAPAVEVVGTWRTPHVTLAATNVDELVVRLLRCPHRDLVNRYHQAQEAP